MSKVDCSRCGNQGDPIAFMPFKNELGDRIRGKICSLCWQEWTKHQQALINHYALNLQDPKAREFLTSNMEQFLFSESSAAE